MNLVPAPLGRRLGAYLLDGLFVTLLVAVGYAVQVIVALNDPTGGVLAIVLGLAVLALPFFYMALKGTAQGSVGYRATRLTLVDAVTGLPIGRGRSVGRWMLFGIIPFAVFSPFFDNEQNRGWHDRIVGSLLVDRDATTLPGAELPTEGAETARPEPSSLPAEPVEPITSVAPMSAPAASPTPGTVVPSFASPTSSGQGLISAVPGMASPGPDSDRLAERADAGPMVTSAAPSFASSPALAPTGGVEDLDATRAAPPRRSPQPAALRLVWDDGTHVGIDGPVRIGRNPDSTDGARAVRIVDETRSLSKSHLLIEPDGPRIRVTDLHSTNGTDVVRAGRTESLVPLTAVHLAVGDRITVGDRIATVEAAG
ncbi:RDD family protein [Demequina sp. NBRC 110054]|uniref:RDD family protein n=1 Tax=Demequina sp. NBRC 110054 TaxID=1570343 RepID=UPI0013564C40|nr:RDD family protein [Demequina sp. NBRC 110054]